MKIGISLNDVLRDFLSQLDYTYDRLIKKSDVVKDDVVDFNQLFEYYGFDNVKEFNKFLYIECPLEIFGHADQMSDGLMNHFNHFVSDIKDFSNHEVELVSREANTSIPSTFFFLSKTRCIINNIRFVNDYADKWNGLDVLITANPKALETKPDGKISVKIKTSYNKNVNADYELDSILDFIKDEKLRDKILNSKITTFEDIK